MIATSEIQSPTLKSNSTMFISKKVSDLFKKVEFFCSKGGSIVFISGEDRCGKTSFSKYLVENLSIQEYEVILLSIVNEQFNPGWLLPKIYQRLGIDYKDKRLDTTSMISKEMDQLFEEHKNLTVVIDSVDLLRDEKAISDISFLMDIQGVSGSKINFVLIGKNVFLEKIKSTDIVNHLSYFCEFPSLDKDDIYDYFCFKARNLGIESCSLSKEGIEYIYNITEGKIYDIGLILDNCLIDAEIKQLRSIDKLNIEEIINKHILSLQNNSASNLDSSSMDSNLNSKEPSIDFNISPGIDDSSTNTNSNNDSNSTDKSLDKGIELKENIGLKLEDKKVEDNINLNENLFSNLSFSKEENEQDNSIQEDNTSNKKDINTISLNFENTKNEKEDTGRKDSNQKSKTKNFLDDIFKDENPQKESESFMDLIKKS